MDNAINYLVGCVIQKRYIHNTFIYLFVLKVFCYFNMFLKWWFHEKRILQTNNFNYFLNKFYFRYPFTWLNMRPGNIVQICTCVTTLRILRPTLSKPTCGQPCLKAKMVPVCRKAWWLLENEKIIIISQHKIYYIFLSFFLCVYEVVLLCQFFCT